MKQSTMLNHALVLGALVAAPTNTASAQGGDYFTNWPKGASPQEVGKNLAEHFVASAHQYTPTIHYSEVAAWYGALTFAQLTRDDRLPTELIREFQPLV